MNRITKEWFLRGRTRQKSQMSTLFSLTYKRVSYTFTVVRRIYSLIYSEVET